MGELIGGIVASIMVVGGVVFGAYKKFGNGNSNGRKREPREVKLSEHDAQLLRNIAAATDTTNFRLGKLGDAIVELRVVIATISGRLE